jgi:hypothetical protein
MYLRTAGEKAAYVDRSELWRNDDEDIDYGEYPPPGTNEYLNLKHGDILYFKNDYRSVHSYAVVGEGDEKRCVSICDDSGYGEIPLEVSAGIENPVEFYRREKNADNGDGVVYIVMSGAKHSDMLSAAAGRRVHHTTKAIWHYDEESYMICSPLSSDLPEGTMTVTLDEHTPDEYISGLTNLEIDPLMRKSREVTRTTHEVLAHGYFPNLPRGAPLNIVRVEGLPRGHIEFRPRFMKCVKAAPPRDEVTKVIVNGYDGAEIIFEPAVRVKIGPCGGVAIWSTVDKTTKTVSMIDLSALNGLEP